MTAERWDDVVVGAGITGLSCAFRLSGAGRRVLVLEAAPRVGGVVRSRRQGGFLFEAGPNSVLLRPAVADLLAAAGLDGEVLRPAGAAARRWVWLAGRLQPLPGGPGGLLRTGLLSARGKLRLLREPFVAEPESEDESVAAFFRRRVGREPLDHAVAPFVSGIWAGDPERLSMRWAMPAVFAMARERGSLVRALAAKRPGGGAAAGRPVPFSLRDGLEALPRRLAERAGEVRAGQPARTLRRRGDLLEVITDDGVVAAPRVVVATPAAAAAALLEEASAGASGELAEVPHAPLAVVSLGYRREQVAHPLDGFGFLAARDPELTILGCLFPSSLFPGRAPAGQVALTAFIGGRRDPEGAAAAEGELFARVRGDLERTLGATGEPAAVALDRWPHAIPQYELGHGRFVELSHRLEAEIPGLSLAGNWLGGVSLPDRVEAGEGAAKHGAGDWRLEIGD